MSKTLDTIASRLAKINPKIKLRDHIKEIINESNSTLEGIKFKPKDSNKLQNLLRNSIDKKTNKKAFATKWTDKNKLHITIAASFAVTNGMGFREIWRFPPLSDQSRYLLPVSVRRGKIHNGWDNKFSSHFEFSVILPNSSSLHCDIAEKESNIHIDDAGFVIEDQFGNIIVTPDLIQHTVNELFFKTWMKALADKVAPTSIVNWVFDNTSIIYPNQSNNFRTGPRFSQIPGLRKVRNVPVFGSILKKMPMPGIQVKLLEGQSYKLTTVINGVPSGNWSATFNLTGTHDFLK